MDCYVWSSSISYSKLDGLAPVCLRKKQLLGCRHAYPTVSIIYNSLPGPLCRPLLTARQKATGYAEELSAWIPPLVMTKHRMGAVGFSLPLFLSLYKQHIEQSLGCHSFFLVSRTYN